MSNAAAPILIPIVEALQAFVTNLGTDPTQVPLKFPGAMQIFLGQVELSLPGVIGTEFTVLQADAQTKLAAWLKSLQTP